MPNLRTKLRYPSARVNGDSIIFVCAMNICRSVVGQAVFNYIKDNTSLEMRVESAGIWAHEGRPCDSTTQEVAVRRGYDLSVYRSIPLDALDPADYNRVFIFEQAHFESVRQWIGGGNKPEYIMTYSRYFGNQEVLMQGYGDMMSVYTHIFDLIEDGCLGLYKQLITEKDNDF